ncbi:MAG: fibrillarin-like rRNA/tRNA 2'-O-methyltransferase [Candidatus Verstraetearchaeota archaeon]|nr:fibrillarin-like rRNA/tRNA 2'-O-methyltransferase [Candidatus Verstraetearchaeota archaeon]
MAKVIEHPKFKMVYYVETDAGRQLATENLTPGYKVYGEELFRIGDVEYRAWNPYRSKLAAAIERGISEVPLKSGSKVLYLGAASGTTPSHVSDIVGSKGRVYCVEFAPRVIRELVEVTSRRKNMIPILGDARKPYSYRFFLEMVDTIYCDVAQPEQARLLAENAEYYLKKGGKVMIAIKARSVDVTMDPDQVFKQEVKVLEDASFKITDMKYLEPYEKDHAMVVAEGP